MSEPTHEASQDHQASQTERNGVKLLWGGKRGDRKTESHYCPTCKRTKEFRVAADLKCLGCGKRLQFRRERA